jgi:tRNA A37 N6-isopentenylltransferase MiaA
MLNRFATPEIAAFAVRESKEDSIRAVGWKILNEMQATGDPFAEELIREIERDRLAKAEELLRRQKRPPEQRSG